MVYGRETNEDPPMAPDHVSVPDPDPETVIVPLFKAQELGFEDALEVIEGIVFGAATADAETLVQPETVWVTVYVPAEETVIVGVDAPVDQDRFEPVAVIVEVPHPLVTAVTGADGTAIGAAVAVEAELVHPETVWVTVYVPAEETVIDGVDAPVDQDRLEPVAVIVEVPQPFVTEVAGADGIAIGAAVAEPAALVHPFALCVTV
jgi:hypothetical protein